LAAWRTVALIRTEFTDCSLVWQKLFGTEIKVFDQIQLFITFLKVEYENHFQSLSVRRRDFIQMSH
jgi:hypothetical protein